MQTVIRPLKPTEIPLLRDFLYEAIFLPEGVEPPPKSIIEQPDLRVYYEEFGQSPHDRALAAEVGGKIIGMVWTRIMHDYGHIDDETPSFAIALYKEYRGQGIGTRLMQEMLTLLQNAGYAKCSLSVQKANPAARLYRRLGFETVEETDEEYLMIYRNKKERSGC